MKKLTGKNQYSNGAFDTNINSLYCYSTAGNCITSWSKGGKLDGGALQVSFNRLTRTTDRSYIIIGIGAVSAAKNYILRFSSLGSPESKIAGVFLRKSLSPYNDLSDRKYFLLNNGRRDNQLLFSSTAEDNDASIVFEVEEQTSPFWIDNIQFYMADVTLTQPDNNLRFEYNTGRDIKTVTINQPYVDAKNKKYSGKVLIKPYTSVILIKQPSIP